MVELEAFGAMRREQEKAGLLPAHIAPPFRQPFDEVLRQRLARAGFLREVFDAFPQQSPPWALVWLSSQSDTALVLRPSGPSEPVAS